MVKELTKMKNVGHLIKSDSEKLLRIQVQIRL